MLDSIQEIQAGMIVKAKGSIIPMSVDSTEGHIASCYWFDGHMLQKGDFQMSDMVVHEASPEIFPVLAGCSVMLKSGSPLMKVERIEFRKNRPHAVCSWQSGNNHYLRKFNSLVLVKVKE